MLAGAVVGDVGLDGDDDSEGRRRLVPKVRLHHCLLLFVYGGFGFALVFRLLKLRGFLF